MVKHVVEVQLRKLAEDTKGHGKDGVTASACTGSTPGSERPTHTRVRQIPTQVRWVWVLPRVTQGLPRVMGSGYPTASTVVPDPFFVY